MNKKNSVILLSYTTAGACAGHVVHGMAYASRVSLSPTTFGQQGNQEEYDEESPYALGKITQAGAIAALVLRRLMYAQGDSLDQDAESDEHDDRRDEMQALRQDVEEQRAEYHQSDETPEMVRTDRHVRREELREPRSSPQPPPIATRL